MDPTDIAPAAIANAATAAAPVAPASVARTATRSPRAARPSAAARPRQFWIVVVAGDAARAAATQGFLQLASGRAGPLERMRGGDGFVLYSPRECAAGAALQAFTAIGRVRDAPIEMAGSEPGGPFQRAAEFLPAGIAPIRPMLPTLGFVRDPSRWGASFRFGVVRIAQADFARIAQSMGRDCAIDFPCDHAGVGPAA
jgi:hypothetical protein